MLNVSARIVNDVAEAEDVLQESFVSAFQQMKRYRGDATFGAWLKKIVVNKSISVLHRRKVDFQEMNGQEEWAEDEAGEVETLEVGQIREAISKLPDGFRTVLSLYLLEGYDHKEIGEILKISENTSKSQYNRARRKLQVILKERYRYER